MHGRVFWAAVAASLGVLGIASARTAIAARDTTELVAKGWSEVELRKILADFEAAYPGRLGSQFGYRIDGLGVDAFDIHFPSGIQHPVSGLPRELRSIPKGV
jgi:hypothetical protein